MKGDGFDKAQLESLNMFTNGYRDLVCEETDFDDICVDLFVVTIGVTEFGKPTLLLENLDTGSKNKYLELCHSE